MILHPSSPTLEILNIDIMLSLGEMLIDSINDATSVHSFRADAISGVGKKV